MDDKTYDLIFNAEEFKDHSTELMEMVWKLGDLEELEIEGTNLFLKFKSEESRKEAYKIARPLVGWLAPVSYYARPQGAIAVSVPSDRAYSRLDAFMERLRQIYHSLL